MKITFYRADGRDLTKLSVVQPRELLSKDDLAKKLQKPRDLSEAIRVAGQASFWVSTALDEECRGQEKGNAKYRFTIDNLDVYKMGKNNNLEAVGLQSAVGGVNEMLKTWIPNKEPHLLLDAKTVAGSNVIALLHCQSGDCDGSANQIKGSAEVSFFTRIPSTVAIEKV
jgi:hypothetical protein